MQFKYLFSSWFLCTISNINKKTEFCCFKTKLFFHLQCQDKEEWKKYAIAVIFHNLHITTAKLFVLNRNKLCKQSCAEEIDIWFFSLNYFISLKNKVLKTSEKLRNSKVYFQKFEMFALFIKIFIKLLLLEAWNFITHTHILQSVRSNPLNTSKSTIRIEN